MNQDHDIVIVFAIDFSEMTDYVIDSALDYAARYQRPELHAVCVIEPSRHALDNAAAAPELPDELEQIDQALRARLASALERSGHPLRDPGTWEVHTHARRGSAAEDIGELAAEVRADTIIVGRHGASGYRPFLLGSVPSRLLVVAHCTVMVVQPPAYDAM